MRWMMKFIMNDGSVFPLCVCEVKCFLYVYINAHILNILYTKLYVQLFHIWI